MDNKSKYKILVNIMTYLNIWSGFPALAPRCPDAMVKAVCMESRRSRVRTPLRSSSLKKKCFFHRSLVKIKYCGEHPWPRGSLLGLRPPGLEFRILCREVSVISSISPSCFPGPVQPIYVQRWSKILFLNHPRLSGSMFTNLLWSGLWHMIMLRTWWELIIDVK